MGEISSSSGIIICLLYQNIIFLNALLVCLCTKMVLKEVCTYI